MSLVDRTAKSQTDSVSFEFDLHHPPEKVWQALTDPILLAEWLLPAVGFRTEPGTSFVLQAPPQADWDGQVQCRVLDCQESRTLRYSWNVGESLRTIVTFTLTRTESGTLLTLVQSGFREEQKRNFGGARYGWRSMGEKLIALLERTR